MYYGEVYFYTYSEESVHKRIIKRNYEKDITLFPPFRCFYTVFYAREVGFENFFKIRK